MGHEGHKRTAPASVRVFVVTASDTRGEAEDQSGAWLRAEAARAGHQVVGHRIVPDEPERIREALAAAAAAGAEAVLVNGGTGIAGRDRTYEAVVGLLEKRLDGFGELFRMLSFQEIGSAAMLSRAVAGVFGGRAIFSVPGSEAAVRLAWERLIGPELPHVVHELRRRVDGTGRNSPPGRNGRGTQGSRCRRLLWRKRARCSPREPASSRRRPLRRSASCGWARRARSSSPLPRRSRLP